jgi:methionine synthase II (cobalamin-independent)
MSAHCPISCSFEADVITFECASSNGRDLQLFAKHKTDKKIGISVVNHCITTDEPAEYVAGLIRKALEYIPPERLVITTDCGFGREGLSRRIAYYQVRGARLRHQYRPPRIGPARSPYPSRRPRALFCECG